MRINQYKSPIRSLFCTLMPFCMSLMLLFVTACSNTLEDEAYQSVQAFADRYFNWQFTGTRRMVTPSSTPWIDYMSSQVRQADVDTLRSMKEGAAVSIDAIEIGDDDSTAHAEVTVSHFLSMDSIGQAGQLKEKAHFDIPLVRHQGKWLVNLSAPLRSTPD